MNFLNYDNELRSYFLGLFMSDGCFYYSEKTRPRSEICMTDNDILIRLKDEITDKYCSFNQRGYTKGNKPIYKLSFFKPINEWFENNKFRQNKTGNEFIPELISNKTFRHFVRGYSDGDGCFTTNCSKLLQWSTGCSSKVFLNNLITKISNNIELCSNLNLRKRKNIEFYDLVLCSEDSIRFGEWIYNNTNLYMNRKRDKFLSLKDNKPKYHRYTKSELDMLQNGIIPPGISRKKAYTYALHKGYNTSPFLAKNN